MKSLTLPLSADGSPKYLQIADAVRGAIRVAKLKPGEALPSTRILATAWGVHRHTVMGAFSELEAEGWIEALPKRFYRVTTTLPSSLTQPKKVIEARFEKKETVYRLARTVVVPETSGKSGYRFSFPSGFPDIRLFPVHELRSHFYTATNSRNNLGYGPPIGHERLVSQIEIYLRRLRGVAGKEVVVTHGYQEAIFLLAQILIRPGDCVAVESMGYPPAVEAFRYAGAALHRVEVDPEGIDPDSLVRLVKRKKIRCLYMTPLHQYPTTVTLTAERRLRIYELANRHGILILEDDYDHEFHYSGQPVAPMASYDPVGLVLYVSTFSKILFPSARLGFMAVPPAIAHEVGKLKRISSRQNEGLMQDAVARWMEDGGFERHLRKMRKTYGERCLSMCRDLERLKRAHPELEWTTPDGGMAVWVDFHRDSRALAARAEKSGVLVQGEYRYRLDGRAGTHLRLGFSGQTPRENHAGLEELARLI